MNVASSVPNSDRSRTNRRQRQSSPPHRRRRVLVGVTALVIIASGVAVGIDDPFTSSPKTNTGVADNNNPTSLATVEHRSLSSQTSLNATLGFAASYTVVGHDQGTITWVPSVGQVTSQGQVLYRVNGDPVVLLYGSTPAYRDLAEGATAASVTGADVAELDADVVAMGYATSSEIPAGSDEFSWWTKQGVEKLQAALGVTQTGTLGFGQVVFLPTAARVTAISATLGAPVGAGQPVLTATSTARVVTIALDAAQQSQIKAGDKVTITLPDGSTTPGVVSTVGTVASAPSGSGSSSSPTVTVDVTPVDPSATGSLDQAPVQVSITTAAVSDALVVPVNALVALSSGGYAVEVVDPDGVHRLVDVTLGIFDDADGLVQVNGTGVAAGQRVVVPAT